MYTQRQRNIIRRCLIKLSDKMEYEQVKKLVQILSNNNVFIVFDYGSFSCSHMDKLLVDMSVFGTDYQVNCDNYDELFKFTNETSYVNEINKIHVKFDADVSYVKLKQINTMSIKDYNMINYVLNDVPRDIVVVDLYCDKNNIFSLSESLRLFSGRDIWSEVFFYDYPRSGTYVSEICSHKNRCVTKDINYRLILDNIIDNKDLKITNRNCLNFLYERCLDGYKCEQHKDIFNLVVDEDFKIRLCDNIQGRKCCTLSPFDCINENGVLTDSYIDCFKEDYKTMCYGCNCCHFIKQLTERK